MPSRRKHRRLARGDDERSTDIRKQDTAGHRVQDEVPSASSSPLSSSDAPTSSDAQMNPTTSRAGAGIANLESRGLVIAGNVTGSSFNFYGKSSKEELERQANEDSTDQGNLSTGWAGQETEGFGDPVNPPKGQRHRKCRFTAVAVVLIALVGILIAQCNFHAVEEMRASSQVQSGETVPMPKVLSDLEYCQQQLKQFYKDTTSTIPSHPLLLTRTVDIDEFFVNLELSREVAGQVMQGDRVKLSGEEFLLEKVHTVSLNTWEDMYNPDIVKESKIILSGGAGYGKTTILGKIANAWSVKGKLAKFKLVFLLKLRQMQKSSCIIDAIFDQILPKDTDLTKSKMKYIIANNQADIAFLLDGLDEIPSNVLKSKKGVYTIKDILRNRVLIKSYVLVTTRPHMIHYVLSGYPHYARVKTLGFTIENRNKYIKSYFPDNITSSEHLFSRLRSQPSLYSLTENPIISQMVCIIWRNQEPLPHNLTSVYAKFAETLVKRRCADNWQQRLNGVMNDLGLVALNGLIDSKNKRLVFDRVEFSECTTSLDDGCKFGFLQIENVTSGLDIKEAVTFHHLSFQEYFASRYLIHLLDNDKATSLLMLKRIGARDLGEMETFLRFCCGQSPKAAKIILKHIRKMNDTLEHAALSRLLLFESGSRKLVTELDKHRFLFCYTLEDMLSLRFYLQALPNKPSGETTIGISCSSHEDITLADELLLGNIDFAETIIIKYTVSKDWNKESLLLEETLTSMEEKLRARLVLAVYINERSVFDFKEVAESITRLSHIQLKCSGIALVKLPIHKVLKMVDALKGCRLFGLAIYDINMHGHLLDLAPLITSSLQHMTCHKCHLLDNDAESLKILLMKSEKSLESLNIGGNAFTVENMYYFALHLKYHFHKLRVFMQGNSVLSEPYEMKPHLFYGFTFATDLDLDNPEFPI